MRGPEVASETLVAQAPGLASRVTNLLARVTYRAMLGAEERERVFELRYQAYVRDGNIQPNAAQRMVDEFDEDPNAYLIGVSLDGRLTASMRLHVITAREPLGPAITLFPEAIVPLVMQGETIIDPSRFVVDRAASLAHPELAYTAMRLPLMAAKHFGAGTVTVTARPEHESFYRRVMRCQRVCEPKPYPGLARPSGLMTAHYPTQAPRIMRQFPFFEDQPGEAAAIFASRPNIATARSSGDEIRTSAESRGEA